jgi:hypothetical protein
MKMVFSPRHRDIEQTTLLLNLRSASSHHIRRYAAINTVEDEYRGPLFQAALSERKRTGEGVRGIAKRFGVDPSTAQRISRPFRRRGRVRPRARGGSFALPEGI